VLALLARNRALVVPKGQLRGHVWGYDVDDHVLAVHISSLRRKLEVHGPRMIHTIQGSGYVLRP
jgi:two-component system OmpR family response regulator